MVRTKNTAVRIGNKAPRKAISTPSLDLKGKSIADLFKSKSSSGDTGNPYCPRETPPWQKEITKFFKPSSKPATSVSAEASSEDAISANAEEDNMETQTDEAERT